MTAEKILEDIKTKKKKKVIIDTDTYNEMDDQYALAYAFGSDKMEILAINAAPFDNDRCSGYADGMEKSYEEIGRVMQMTETVGKYPVFKGSRTRISENENFAPSDSPAARNIIKCAKESDDIIYILSIGAITNVVSAVLLDPSITEKICVVWLGGNCLDYKDLGEFNLIQDYAAGQLLLDLDIPLVMLPALDHGTSALKAGLDDLQKIKGDSRACKFFREELPSEFEGDYYSDGTGWKRIIWDVAATAAIAVPEALEFSVIPAPVFADNQRYAFDKTRRKIIYMDKVDRDMVFKDMCECISRL